MTTKSKVHHRPKARIRSSAQRTSVLPVPQTISRQEPLPAAKESGLTWETFFLGFIGLIGFAIVVGLFYMVFGTS